LLIGLREHRTDWKVPDSSVEERQILPHAFM